MTDLLNTHNYDGKLNAHLLPPVSLSLDEKKERGQHLILATSTMNPIARHYLKNIVDSIGTPSNVDNTNGLVADDLICLCWVYHENPAFIIELETQLLDMATGFCPQGRTHRLYQILTAFI